MDVIISRKYNFTETQGSLYVINELDMLFYCVTIELPRFVVPMQINSPKIDCILPGVYPAERILSPTKGECFLLKNVPGRSAVEIHIGNFASGKHVDTQGCILPGMRFEDINKDGNIDVADSTGAMKKLLSILPDAFKIHII